LSRLWRARLCRLRPVEPRRHIRLLRIDNDDPKSKPRPGVRAIGRHHDPRFRQHDDHRRRFRSVDHGGRTGLGFTDAYVSTISGNGYGINATNLGAGNLTITATGSVSGGALQSVTASGIQAKNYGASLTISAATVVGGNYGVASGASAENNPLSTLLQRVLAISICNGG
jgi:hypothetical protein